MGFFASSLLILLFLGKDRLVVVFVLFYHHVGFEWIQHIWHGRALESARSTSRQRTLGRGLESSKGPRWVQTFGPFRHCDNCR